jgi:hypothetical protein
MTDPQYDQFGVETPPTEVRVRVDGSRLNRKLEPIVDAKGRLTHWKCSACRWTRSAALDSLIPLPESIQAFRAHDCAHHGGGETKRDE